MFKDIGQLKKMGNEANQRFEAEGGMAGATDKRADTVFYVPAVEMRCGIGAVTWDFAG